MLAKKCFSKFCYFVMEGCHRMLKRMLRNVGRLSLLRGRRAVQVIVDNPTIHYSLAAHARDATKRAQRGEQPISIQGYPGHARRCLPTNMQRLQT